MIWGMFFWIIIFYLIGGPLVYYGLKNKKKKILIPGFLLIKAATITLIVALLI